MSVQYLAQDPRTLLYYRFTPDGMAVIADVPQEQFRERGSLFHPEHLVHLPADTLLTEADKDLTKYFGRKKGAKAIRSYSAKKKQVLSAKQTRARKLKLKLLKEQREERKRLKQSQMRYL